MRRGLSRGLNVIRLLELSCACRGKNGWRVGDPQGEKLGSCCGRQDTALHGAGPARGPFFFLGGLAGLGEENVFCRILEFTRKELEVMEFLGKSTSALRKRRKWRCPAHPSRRRGVSLLKRRHGDPGVVPWVAFLGHPDTRSGEMEGAPRRAAPWTEAERAPSALRWDHQPPKSEAGCQVPGFLLEAGKLGRFTVCFQ